MIMMPSPLMGEGWVEVIFVTIANLNYSPPLLPDPRSQFLAAFPVSRETEARLARFEALLLERSRSLSLIADSTRDQIWTRHFLDSAQLAPLIPHPQESVVDLGAGAGFPGLVLAIMGLPKIQLVENNMQKVAFLRSVIADLALPVTVHPIKAESVRPLAAGAVVARALKPLSQLLDLSRNLRGPDTVCIFPKGRRAAEELTEAEKSWRMTIERFPSLTSAESTIFRLTRIAKAGA
jgi:16S rRNA (guanine527-N7)-methyltransferase